MLTRQDLPVSLEKGLRLEFQTAQQAYIPMTSWRSYVSTIPSSAATEKMYALGAGAQLKEFKGERAPEKVREFNYVITNKEYEQTMTVRSTEIEDDQTGQVKLKATNMGQEYELGLDSLMGEFLRLGTSNLCYDGNPFFGSSHLEGDSGVQVNSYSGLSYIAGATSVQFAQQVFGSFKDDKGKSKPGRLTDIMVKRGSHEARIFREIANSQYTVEASLVKDNVFRGAFNVVELDYGLTYGEWIAMDNSKVIKPVVVTDRTGLESPEFTALENDSEAGFWRREFAYGTYVRFGLGYGNWRTAILFKVA